MLTIETFDEILAEIGETAESFAAKLAWLREKEARESETYREPAYAPTPEG